MIDNLKIAISENDIEKARRIMINELIGTNYPHEVFKDAMELASECNIFEEHDNGKLTQNVKEWDKEYLEKLITGLGKNFSRERFLTAYYVARKLEQEKKDAEIEDKCTLKVYENYKDKMKLLEIGGAIAGALAIGAGIYYLSKRKNK